MGGINIRLGVTKRDIKILTTALREYAERHSKPICDAYEAGNLAHLIEYQFKKQEGQE